MSGFPNAYYMIGNTALMGIPIPVLFFIFGIVILYFLLECNIWGLQVYSIGTNPIAALFSGVRNRKMVFEVYMISGLFIGLAAIIMSLVTALLLSSEKTSLICTPPNKKVVASGWQYISLQAFIHCYLEGKIPQTITKGNYHG